MAKPRPKRPLRPPQKQSPPGEQSRLVPQPKSTKSSHRGSGKLAGKVALITGADSGIGRAVALAFAREGASIAAAYLNEHRDARATRRAVEEEGGGCLLLPGDLASAAVCRRTVRRTLAEFGRLDILVNNAAEQHPRKKPEQMTERQWLRTFRTNVFAMFSLVNAALPRMRKGAVILNNASVTAYRGSPELLDYSASKGAIVAYTRSLALALVKRGIRVNGVAPGPIWTPLIASTFAPSKVATFGSDTPMGRAGEPAEVAACFLFLASDDASYLTGQVLHPNGGEIVNA